jgi:hypothetical protein
MVTTIVIQTDYSQGLAFTGKAAAELVKLLDQAIPVVQEKRHDEYAWWEADKDSTMTRDRVTFHTRDPRDPEHAKIRERLDIAESTVKKHKELIEAAEALNPEPQ